MDLQLALALHMIPLRSRLKYKLRMKNPLLDEIKDHYSYAWIIAQSLASHLTASFDTTLSEDEVRSLALHLNLSLEKGQRDIEKKNAVGMFNRTGNSQTVGISVSKKFGDYINSLTCVDAFSLGSQDFSNTDFVFTTVPILVNVPVPIIETGLWIDEKQEMKIKTDLLAGPDLSKYFDIRLFFRTYSFTHNRK